MKKNTFKSLAIMAIIALMGTACGGGSSNPQNNEMPTDGILGTFPQKYFNCVDGINTARADMAVGTEEEHKTAKAKLEELQEQLKTMAETENLASIEIPTEVATGIPFKVVKPFSIIKAEEKQLTLQGEVESTEAVDQYAAMNYGYIVAYDKNGKPFTVGQHGNYAPEGSALNWAAGTKGTLTIYLSLAAFNIDGLARLDKLLIVTGKSEEMKQAAAAMSELQSAAMAETLEKLKKMKKE